MSHPATDAPTPLPDSARRLPAFSLAAVALHHLVERPARRLIMRRTRRRDRLGTRSMP